MINVCFLVVHKWEQSTSLSQHGVYKALRCVYTILSLSCTSTAFIVIINFQLTHALIQPLFLDPFIQRFHPSLPIDAIPPSFELHCNPTTWPHSTTKQTQDSMRNHQILNTMSLGQTSFNG